LNLLLAVSMPLMLLVAFWVSYDGSLWLAGEAPR
jgi:hypothetical protein